MKREKERDSARPIVPFLTKVVSLPKIYIYIYIKEREREKLRSERIRERLCVYA